MGPCVDPISVWICLPFFDPSLIRPPAMRFAVGLPAGLRSCVIAADRATRSRRHRGAAYRILRRAPEWHGLGIYLDVQLQTVDGQAYRGRARLTEFLEDRDTRRLFEQLELGSGDRLQIVVKLRRPSVYRDPGVFDFRRYLEREGVYWTGTIRSPRLITVMERGWHGPDRVKNWIQGRLEAAFQSDRNIQGLISGMVLGRKDSLTPEVERQFQAGGLYHLVVVSGFNLAVVSSVAMWLAGFIPWSRRSRLLFVLACATGYALLVEGQAPVERAFLMVCFLISGKLLDRGYAAMNTVAAAGFLILLFDPSSVEDSSFQMTFAAVAAVIGLGVPASQWTLGMAARCAQGFQRFLKRHLPVGPSCRLANHAAGMVRTSWIADLGSDDPMVDFAGDRRSGNRFGRGRDGVSTFHGGILPSVLSRFPFVEHSGWCRGVRCHPAGITGYPAASAVLGYCSVEHHTNPCRVAAHRGLDGPVARDDVTGTLRAGLALGELRCGRTLACVRHPQTVGCRFSWNSGTRCPAARRHSIWRLFPATADRCDSDFP